MEPRVASESDGTSPPLIGWTSLDSPSSPSSQVFKTANQSPIILRKDSLLSSIYSSPIKSIGSNNNINVDVIQFADGVKFEDAASYNSKDDSICSSQSDEDEEDVKEPKVPDGGWGWVVVVASLLISMVADGISFSFGLVYIKFLDHFGESKSKTAWIGSLFMAVPLLSGPVMSALVDRYGCRWMTILGGVVSAFGFVLASLGNSIEWEYLTFGVIAGLGLGLCYVTAVVSIAYWFDKHRTLATSLGACGTGIGTFVYAPMTQYFLDEFGWRGTVLLLAGTFLNMCVCGALMRDPDWWVEEQKAQASVAGTKSIRNASSCGSVSGVDGEGTVPGPEEIRKMIRSGKSPEYVLTMAVDQLREEEKKEAGQEKAPLMFQSVVHLPTFVRQQETVPLEVLHQLRGNGKVLNIILENYPTLLSCRSVSDQGKLNQIGTTERCGKRIPTMSLRVKKLMSPILPVEETLFENSSEDALEAYNEPLLSPSTELPPIPLIMNGLNGAAKHSEPPIVQRPYRRHFSLRDPGQNNFKNIRVHRNSVVYRGAMLNIPKYHLRASSCPNIYRNSMTTLARENQEKCCSEALDFLRGIFDFSMFIELHFLLMSMSTILLFIWFIVPYFYLAEHMIRQGYTEQDGSLIISIIGVVNCIGMVVLGWAGDQPWMNQPKAYAVCLMGCGISCAMIPWISHSWWLLALDGCFFGVTFASSYSFTPTILVSLIPIERFTTAYGLILLCQGIGNLCGPPLAGLIFDLTGSWDISFYMAGLWIIISGVLVGIIPYTKNRLIWGDGQLEMDRVSNA